MTTLSPSEAQPISHWASKRSACDRCRSQKLRCLRDGHGGNSESCARCIRARTECVTSSAKPVGRPPRAGTPRVNSTYSMHNAPGLVQSQPSSDQQTGATMPLDTELLFDFPDEEVLMNMSNTFDAVRSIDSFCPFSLDFTPGSSPSMLVLDGITQPLEIEEEQQRLQNEPGVTPSSAAFANSYSDPTLRLSSLNLSLSKQLSFVKSVPWEVSLVSIITYSSGINGTYELPTIGNPKEANPLGDILHSTSEFLAIIQMYLPPEDQLSPQCDPDSVNNYIMEGQQPSSPPSPPTSTCSDPGSPYCITTTLALLSCYLQIIAIYNAIFWKVYASLCGTPEAFVSGLQTVPDLHLAGFPLQHGSLQIKILIQVIMHQSEMIEKALGLPVEYCVSGRREHYTGLLGGREARALLKAVMGFAGEDQHEGGGSEVTEVGLGLKYVVLLRENIERVRQLL